MAYNYLEAHALSNVWCAPYQDNQAIFEMARLTPVGGAFNYFTVQNSSVWLPIKARRFHVYQLGQVNPMLLGIYPVRTWNTFAAACNKTNLIVDLYADSGLEMPRSQSWYMVTENHNLIVAVLVQPQININLDTEPLYLRVYSNAYYKSEAATTAGAFVYVEGRNIATTDDVLALQADLAQYASKTGVVYSFVNGFKVSNVDLLTVAIGDVVEFVYDASIYKVVDFPISSLQSFNSTLDTMAKYLLHYPGNVNEIDYEDDIDVFIMQPQLNNRWTGVYYHRNAGNGFRMVTHKDYSITANYITAFCTAQGWNPYGCHVRLHIRNGGWNRSLVFENNRINELYKLPDAEIIPAMIGANSTVPNWKAATLEASAYTQIMGSLLPILSPDAVQAAYGYNAISKLLGDTPQVVTTQSGQKVVSPPYGLQLNATGYEYDVNGYLLGTSYHMAGSTYACAYPSAALVEMISGEGGTLLDETYGATTVALNPTSDYRMYTCPIVGGSPTNVWTDVTNTAQYVLLNGNLTWLTNPAHVYTLVRGDANFLSYSLELAMSDGLLNFSLTQQALRNGVTSNWIMQIPMGELDLWLNGKALVENIDYYVNFPQIVIVNKNFLAVNPVNGTQRVDVRFTGFCNADFSRTVQDDSGFIQYGLLSDNNRFDIRDDKVLRIQVNGSTMIRTGLQFQEGSAGVSAPNALNGTPYLVRDIVVPLRGLTTTDAYTMRSAAMVVDTAVSNYMTAFFPMPEPTGVDQIEAQYPVYSPFCCKLLYDMNAGVLDDPRMYQQYADSVVAELCAPYLYLLKCDPTQTGLTPDPRFVVIQPHNLNTVISTSIYHYQFLQRAVNLYLNGLVTLTGAVQIATYTGGS